jgi:polyhydroxyalkanoate synthesis regulator phasin
VQHLLLRISYLTVTFLRQYNTGVAVTEFRDRVPSTPSADKQSVLPRVLTVTLTAGEKALDRLGKMGSAVKTRFSKTTPDRTEEALSFLPRQERAEVWARFGDLNTHDVEAVAPVRKTAAEARINSDYVKGFVNTALVNSRHRQGLPFRRTLELQPDGEQKVNTYLKKTKPTPDEELMGVDMHLDRAAKVFEERVDKGELDPSEARAEMERFAVEHKGATVKIHLAVLADRRAAEAIRAKENAAKDGTQDSPKVTKLENHRQVEEVAPAVVVFAGVAEEVIHSR